MNEFYIYVYFDPTRDMEAIYVGKGKGNRSHWHLTRIDRHPFTQRIQCIARQGCIPIIERYEELSEQAAFDLEIALIKEIGRKDLGTGTLLNLTDGGEGASGYVFSAETKAKIGAAIKGRKCSDERKAKISAVHKGKIFSDEYRAKLSAAQKGKKYSAETLAKLSAAARNISDETRAKLSEAAKRRITSDAARAKLSDARKGKKFWNNGVINKVSIECPEGFIAGKLIKGV